MNNFLKMLKQLKSKWFYGMLLIYLGIVFMHPEKVQAATENVTLHQYHPDSEFEYSTGALNDYFYEIYPNENQLDYKKFMKYTYKISDDSIIGLEENSYPEAAAIWLGDGDGNLLTVMPYDVTVYALAPGTATLKVYDGSKLVDTFNFTIVADTEYSPSSYVDLTEDEEYDGIQSTETKNYRISKANISEENKLIKQFAKAAANPKYTTTNQRIQAALNAVIGHGSSMISETKYKELDYLASKKDISLGGKYRTAYSMLIEKKVVSKGFAIVNKAVLSNLGFNCRYTSDDSEKEYGCETWNYVEIYKQNEYNLDTYELDAEESDTEDMEDDGEEVDEEELNEEELYEEAEEEESGYLGEVGFSATTKLQSDYNFSSEDAESIYKSTHLPAWIIGKDTKQQVISVGQSKALSTSDLNNNLYSSDTSIVTVKNGKITGVKPGVAVVYRYNDTYCDMFYVLVKQKGEPKTIKAKIYKETTKTYFSASDYAPYIKGGQNKSTQLEDWENLRLFELEPIFGNGSTLTTKYSKGKLEGYITKEGKSTLFYTIGLDD